MLNREKLIKDAGSDKGMRTEHSGKKGVYKAERLRNTDSARSFRLETESDSIGQHGSIVKDALNKKKDSDELIPMGEEKVSHHDEMSKDFWMHM